MDSFIQNAASTPGGLGDNRYVKTSRYQFAKMFKTLFGWGAMAFSAIIRLIIDVFKGIVGKS